MASLKTNIVEWLFFKRWNEETANLDNAIVRQADIQEALQHFPNSKLSNRNIANFMKDIVRGQSASRNWPEKLKILRYTAVQRPGDGNSFEFIPYAPGQTEPFPDPHKPKEGTPRFKIQSISLPLEAKQLGRSDEPWLLQSAVNLRVIETHFATMSRIPVVQLTHLQMSVKLRRTEIDALFLAICIDEKGKKYNAIVTCEAKQARERILESQLINQVEAAFAQTPVDVVIPLGLRAVRKVGFYVVEFEPIRRPEIESLKELRVATEAVYEPKPPLKGIQLK